MQTKRWLKMGGVLLSLFGAFAMPLPALAHAKAP